MENAGGGISAGVVAVQNVREIKGIL